MCLKRHWKPNSVRCRDCCRDELSSHDTLPGSLGARTVHDRSARPQASCERSSPPSKRQFLVALVLKRGGRGGRRGGRREGAHACCRACGAEAARIAYDLSSPFNVPPPPRKLPMHRETTRRCVGGRQRPRAARWTGQARPLQDSYRAAIGARTFCARPATRGATFLWRPRRAGGSVALVAPASYRSTVGDDPDRQRANDARTARFLSQLRALLLRPRDVPKTPLETKLSAM